MVPELSIAGLPAGVEEDLSLDSSVLATLRVVTAWFAGLIFAFAILDLWLLPAIQDAEGRHPSREAVLVASGTTVGIAAVLAVIWLWLHFRPPAARFASHIAFLIGLAGLSWTLTYLVASPSLFRVSLLVVLVIAAGCIFLSRRWFASYVTTAITIWFGVAYWQAPEIPWYQVTADAASSVGMAGVVLTVRRRSVIAMQRARQLDRRLGEELASRLRIGRVLSAASTRFLTLSSDDFDAAVDETLREIREVVQADHAFVCRLRGDPMRTSVVYECTAPHATSRRDLVQDLSLMDQVWFCRKLLAGEPTNVPDVAELPAEAAAERAALEKLGAKAFLAVPLTREFEAPWGYFGVVHDSRRMEWSQDEVNLLHVAGDIFLSTLERQRAEREVRKSEARFRRLFDANIIGVFFADVYGNITDANEAFLAITGYEASDLPLRLGDLTPPEWRDHDEAAVLRLLKDGVDHPWEKEFIDKRGQRLPILIGGAILSHDRGECVGFVLDLRQRKEAERKVQELNAELQRASRLGVMGEMAAGLAHEVHQPLAAIANYSSGARRRLARGRLEDGELDAVFDEIAGQCERAATVIRNIRNFVQRRHPVRRAVDLNETVRECLQLVRFDVRQRDVEVETDLATLLPPALTDATQLSQILLNLMLNAVQAMENHPAPRRLTITTRSIDPRYVEVIVADTGPGVLPEARDRMFDQFFTTKPGGLGMGLSLSRSIAESHAGKLELIHTGPDGTKFLLRLPRADDAGRDSGATPTTQGAAVASHDNL